MFRTEKKNTVQEKAGRRKQLREKKNKKLKPKQMYLSSQVSSLLWIKILYGFVLLVILPILWDVSTQQDSSWCHWKSKA